MRGRAPQWLLATTGRWRSAATTCEVLAAAAAAPPSVVIVEPRDRAGAPTAPLIRALRHGYPSVAVLAYCPVTPAGSTDIMDAVRAGASGLVLRGYDDIGAALQAALRRAADACTAESIMRELAPVVPTGARPIVEYCLWHAREALTVSDLARALGVHRRTLVNHLSAAGLPGPRAVLAWSRLLAVAQALEARGRPIERVALEFDFPSAGALRGLFRRYTRLQPQEVRENGGAACVLRLCRRALTAGTPARADVPTDGRVHIATPPA